MPVIGDDIILIQVYRPCIDEIVWEIPRGFIDANEISAESATRELEEELNIKINALELKSLGFFMPEAGIIKARVQLFYADLISNNNIKLSEEAGHIKLKTFSIKKVKDMIGKSTIQDPSTIVAVYRAELDGYI